MSETYGAGPETLARALRMCSGDLANTESALEDACARIAELERRVALLSDAVEACYEMLEEGWWVSPVRGESITRTRQALHDAGYRWPEEVSVRVS